MTIKQFIEKAIEGGWKPIPELRDDVTKDFKFESIDMDTGLLKLRRSIEWIKVNVYAALLDPLAWQAVGKVEGWRPEILWDEGGVRYRAEWQDNMLRMTEALIKGKTIEQYLETL